MTLPHLSPKKLSRLLADFVYLEPGDEREISRIEMDSRRLQTGDLFLACRGATLHGKRFVREAFDAGVAAVAVDVDEDEILGAELVERAQEKQVPLLAVVRLDQKLGEIAARFYERPSEKMTVIGVTGTNGKTSVTQFLAQCLHSEQQPCGVIGTLGNGIWGKLKSSIFTTPLAPGVQKHLARIQAEGADFVAMEVSSHALDQGRVNAVDFDVAVLTNLSRDHLDYHGDMQAYAAAKAKLFYFHGLRTAVLNWDDELGRKLGQELSSRDMHVVAYTLEAEEDESIENIQFLQAAIVDRSQKGMHLRVKGHWGECELQTGLLGDFNASNLLAVLGTLLSLGVSLEEAVARVVNVTPPAGRMECFVAQGLPLVVVDYAHTPDALTQVLRTLRSHCDGSLWVVFGCGGDRDKGKRALMAQAAESIADKIIVTNDNPRTEAASAIVEDILQGFSSSEDVDVIYEREHAIVFAIKHASKEDIVLLAGKGHEDYQIIGTERKHFSDRETVMEYMGLAA